MKRLSDAGRVLALSMAVGLLLAGSSAAGAEAAKSSRRAKVKYGSGFFLAGFHLEGASTAAEEANVTESTDVSGDCATCQTYGSGHGGPRRGCCADIWDGYCGGHGGCRRGCCAHIWDGYCGMREGGGCGVHHCRGCGHHCSQCDSCGCEDSGEVITSEVESPKPTTNAEPATPEPPKPALDRSASLRRVR